MKDNKGENTMLNNQQGTIVWTVIGIVLALLLILGFMVVGLKLSDERVSGVVYNTSNNRAISGNTRFSVRASEDTYVSEENRSSYCLPPGSEYIELINRAAENKDIKVVVTASKYFKIKAPWTCVDNVRVEIQE